MDNRARDGILPRMKSDFDILIAGGGLNGPVLALALADAGLRVAVVDAQPARARAADDFDGRAYALALGSQRILSAVGVWPALAARAQPIRQVVATQGHPGEGSGIALRLDSAEIEEGPVGQMIEDRFLYRALQAGMAGRVTVIPATRIERHDPDATGVTAHLSDGQRLRGAVLIGADGRGSGTAARAGIRRTGHGYQQTALVAAIDHELPHHGTAYQIFLPTGPLAILPLPGNRSSIVWSERAESARAIEALDDAGFLDVLRPRFGDFLGRITLAGPRFSYPLGLTLAESYVAPRMALVGDAAHGIHPLAGQGLNIGLRDVAALAEVLTDAYRRGEDPGAADVLDRYQAWRRFDDTNMALFTDAINTLFSNDNMILRTGRSMGLGLVNAIGPLRRRLMRQAAGLTAPGGGALPRLMTGKPL
ncbi:UbiH/UbiF/VisC/COQ6 family ubiquinone biosynthesis hydroxylase [Paracoccus pacificus]|uniref:UbiH/UbiF/VisC/COQ6 family ubiquinone biosynthesis hydroxylase n=1 Tax=Paracoccus pacificus TaxID=1463598 RepID=A0ABW4R395_9RHOB